MAETRANARVYDLIVVGAGVAGSELAWGAAERGCDVLLVTTSMDTAYNLLGDRVTLKPPPGTLMAALHAEEARADGFVTNWGFHRRAKETLERAAKIHLLQSNVSALLGEDGVRGVETWEGVDRLGEKVALCVGSFLRARLTVGTLTEEAGRLSEMAYDDLYEDLAQRGFSFEDALLRAEFTDGSLPYTVACRRFAGGEWDATTFRLGRMAGLYAAGVCAAGYLPFEAAAAQGRALAARLG